jgi:hypothetical protein
MCSWSASDRVIAMVVILTTVLAPLIAQNTQDVTPVSLTQIV